MNKKFLSVVLSAGMVLAPLGENSCFAYNCALTPDSCEKLISKQEEKISALEELVRLQKEVISKQDEGYFFLGFFVFGLGCCAGYFFSEDGLILSKIFLSIIFVRHKFCCGVLFFENIVDKLL